LVSGVAFDIDDVFVSFTARKIMQNAITAGSRHNIQHTTTTNTTSPSPDIQQAEIATERCFPLRGGIQKGQHWLCNKLKKLVSLMTVDRRKQHSFFFFSFFFVFAVKKSAAN